MYKYPNATIITIANHTNPWFIDIEVWTICKNTIVHYYGVVSKKSIDTDIGTYRCAAIEWCLVWE